MEAFCEQCGGAFNAVRANAKFCSSTCRLTAHRERKRSELEPGSNGSPTEVFIDVVNEIVVPELLEKPASTIALTEDEYVERELAVTRAQMARPRPGTLKDYIDPRDGKGRMQRCEDYARWRFRGFLAGEVASL